MLSLNICTFFFACARVMSCCVVGAVSFVPLCWNAYMHIIIIIVTNPVVSGVVFILCHFRTSALQSRYHITIYFHLIFNSATRFHQCENVQNVYIIVFFTPLHKFIFLNEEGNGASRKKNRLNYKRVENNGFWGGFFYRAIHRISFGGATIPAPSIQHPASSTIQANSWQTHSNYRMHRKLNGWICGTVSSECAVFK